MPRASFAVGVLLATVFVCLMTASSGAAEPNWPRFRGPDGSGHCDQEGLPVRWGPDDVIWRVELEGRGHSSACTWGDRVFFTTTLDTDAGQTERIVLALNPADGKTLWRHVASVTGSEKLHKMNSYASPTCATDGQRVVAFFGPGGIHCYDLDGKPLWSRNLGDFPGTWGTAASPVIVDNLVIQNCDAEGDGYLVALDKQTGDVVWKTLRPDRPKGGWNTPIMIDTGSRRELIVNGEYGVRGYDPTGGRELWFCKSFNGRGTPIPAFGHGLLHVISGKSGAVYAVRPGGSGDVTESHMVWHTPRVGGRDLSSPILVDDYLFVVNMAGIGTCYNATTGKELWQERLEGAFAASPIAVGGLIYVQNEAGQTLVIKPGDSLEVVARNDLPASDSEIFRSTMAPYKGRFIIRSNRAVYCVGKPAAKGRAQIETPGPGVAAGVCQIVQVSYTVAAPKEKPAPDKLLAYVGTYTRGGSDGIYLFEMDLNSGAMKQIATTSGITNPSFLALHPSGRFLYSVAELGSRAAGDPGGAAALAIDPKTGKLSHLNQQSVGGTGPCHLVVDKSGKNLLVANYAGGSVAVLPIADDGRLRPASCFIQHTGSSVLQPRQSAPHAHGIYLDSQNRFAFVPDLGLDKVLVYRFDTARGSLTPNDPPAAAVSPGSGPRHFAFHPGGKFAYVINEISSTLTAFQYDARRGVLDDIQTLSTLPEGFDGKNSTAEIFVSPCGKMLYGSNRGHDSIAIFAIDEATGRLEPLGHESTQGETPRFFGIDPTGTFLLAANQTSGSIVVLRINPNTGALKPTGHKVEVPMPVCIQFLAKP